VNDNTESELHPELDRRLTSIEGTLGELRALVVAFSDEQQTWRDRISHAERELASIRPRLVKLEGNGAAT
jgi:hypothetical protein